jgi:hypothetical protein
MPNFSAYLDVNIRADRYLIVSTVATCRYCGGTTPLVAVGLAPGHQTLDVDDDLPEDDVAVETWSVAGHAALLFHIAYLPYPVQRRLNAFTSAYRLDDSTYGGDFCWLNHCVHCDEAFHDHELFCEPGGAFLAMSEAEAGRLQISSVNQVFEACAAGYAYEPQFLQSMSRT